MKKLVALLSVLIFSISAFPEDIFLKEASFAYVADNGELVNIALGAKKSSDKITYLLLIPQGKKEVVISDHNSNTTCLNPNSVPGQYELPSNISSFLNKGSIKSLLIDNNTLSNEMISINNQLKRQYYSLSKRIIKAKVSDKEEDPIYTKTKTTYSPIPTGGTKPLFSSDSNGSYFNSRRNKFLSKYRNLPESAAYYFQKSAFQKRISIGLTLTSGVAFVGSSFIDKTKTRNICYIASGAIGLGGIISYLCALSNENKAAYKLEYELGKTAIVGLSDNGSGIKLTF